MREQLNSNPLVQAAVVGVLLISAGFFLLSTMGGGEEETAAPTEATVEIAGTGVSGSATGASPGEAVEGAISSATASAAAVPIPPEVLAEAASPPPQNVTAAFDANQIVTLLFVRNGGIDDRIVASTVRQLDSLQGVASFVVPASEIARYASITQGVDVQRVPALIVIRPKRLDDGIPSASVHYGFQSPQSIAQAVIDAGYKGPTLDYHP